MNGNLHVLIRNRDGVVLEEEIKSVSSMNKIGKFDVLPSHANFISIINNALLLETLKGDKKEIPVDTGILKVRDNQVDVYLGIIKK